LSLCFIRDGDRILLLHRKNPPNAGQWDGVGGKLEPGEDPYAACVREVREETGLEIRNPLLRALLLITARSTGHLWVLFLFTADAPGGPPVESDEGELGWVQIDRIGTLPVIPDLPLILPHLLSAGDILVIRSELETEDTDSMARVEILGPSSRTRVLYER
jgi:8-oxo-dGTP diphosphatase